MWQKTIFQVPSKPQQYGTKLFYCVPSKVKDVIDITALKLVENTT